MPFSKGAPCFLRGIHSRHLPKLENWFEARWSDSFDYFWHRVVTAGRRDGCETALSVTVSASIRVENGPAFIGESPTEPG